MEYGAKRFIAADFKLNEAPRGILKECNIAFTICYSARIDKNVQPNAYSHVLAKIIY